MGGGIAKLNALKISISSRYTIKFQHFDDLSVYSGHNCIINRISSILFKIISMWMANIIFDDKLSWIDDQGFLNNND